ncbi:DUF6328 family protein [Amnibacterium sp.]|uniref:DUF6328 family protein n=1 Tax=Amnibacterium sp. TaxID=1872496 RepID=UPI00262B1185|nr:DUF6328 family protein [Amnibacterium sp.]MCU1474713.1 sodium:proton antiporter [Amnibacterium sp.]
MAGSRNDQRDAVPGDGRDETEAERLDRNWNALLQELRVLETGTQILTGFLLTVAFQQTFSKLDPAEVTTYLITVSLAALATVLVLAPVPLHRGLFRQHRMDVLVHWTDRILRVALAVAGLAIVGVAVLVFHVAAGPVAGIVAGAVMFVIIASLWLALPAMLRRD